MKLSLEELLREVSTLRGGSLNIYKPVVALEWYEHDDVASIRVGRCKGLEEIVYQKTFTGHDAVRVVLEGALAALKETGAS